MMNEKLSLLKRYFKNRYSQNDYLKLKEMIHSPDGDFEANMQQHWNDYKPEKETDKQFSDVLRVINKNSTRPIKKIFTTFSRIAAILIIPLFIAIGFLYLEFNEYLSQKEVFVEISSPVGGRTSINLPDGSTVWLNGESSIKYPAVFNESRKVQVIGEAFFKVESDIENPFLVGVKDVFVKATGTEFNVLAYEDDPSIRVILKEGKVDFLDISKTTIKKIDPGYQLVYNNSTSEIQYSEINPADYISWIYGKLIFRNAPFSEVIRRLEYWYGVDIKVEDNELLNLHFKATFVEEGIEDALRLLQTTATFDYQFVKRQLRSDGSYENPKIYISKK